MNLCNYLYNISLLDSFVGMTERLIHKDFEISTERERLTGQLKFEIGVGFDLFMTFGQYGHSFYLDYVHFWYIGLEIIKYERNTKEMYLRWIP